LAQADKGKAADFPNPQNESSQHQPAAVEEAETTVQDEDYYRPCPIVEEEPEE